MTGASLLCVLALVIPCSISGAEGVAKKSRNRTNELMKTEILLHDQSLGNGPSSLDPSLRQPLSQA